MCPENHVEAYRGGDDTVSYIVSAFILIFILQAAMAFQIRYSFGYFEFNICINDDNCILQSVHVSCHLAPSVSVCSAYCLLNSSFLTRNPMF